MQKYKTREEYLQRAYVLLNETAFKPNEQECPAIKVSCSFIVGTRASNKKTMGQCAPRSHSDADINEIRIVPTVDDSFEAIDTLAHEMAHAVDDCQNGHKAQFKKICLAVGLDGNKHMRYAEAGEKLGKTIKNIIATIGEYPHDKVDISNVKKQGSRMLKHICENDCGASCYQSAKQSDENPMLCSNCSGWDDDAEEFQEVYMLQA